MKNTLTKLTRNILSAALAAGLAGAGMSHAADPEALRTDRDRLSYAIGVETARAIAKGEADIDRELLIRGMRDALSNQALLAPEPELRRIMNAFRGQIYAKTAQSRRAVTEGNKRKEQAFLAENKQKEGVIALPSGIQYRVVTAGDGTAPNATDTIEYTYRGTLLDGSEFANTGGARPLRQKMNVVTPAGLKEVVQQMPVGARWQVWVPSSLGYGERGVGEDIGPNEVLVYDVELRAAAQ